MNNGNIGDRIKSSMKKLDDAHTQTPDFLCFTELVRKEKQLMIKRQNIQFAVFIVLSFFIVAGICTALFVNIQAFAIIQSLPLFVIGLLFFIRRRGNGSVGKIR